MPTPAEIAEVCHEANRVLQRQQRDSRIAVSPPWHATDPETQASAVQGVEAHLADPDLTPEQSHENWCDFKYAHGWSFGPVKDEARKEHPLLVPYSELPAEQQVKDALFSAIVRALS